MSNIRPSPSGLRWLRGEYASTVFIAAALLPTLFAAAVLWILPVGGLSVDRSAMAARDYTDMWAAGHLVALGQGDTLFDLAAFNAALHSMFGAGFPHQVWPYPPPILLLAVPLSWLPLVPGFLLYTAATAALLWLALRSGGLTRPACAAVLLSPALADNALAGQNGSLTAALLFGGLFLVELRPVLAGVILGALVIKPQLGMLVPLCLIASGNWRALLAMATSASLLIAASALLFGTDAWIGFLAHTRPMIAAILEAPWRALPAQQNFASPLMAARSIGASMQFAYGLQMAVMLLCGAVAWWTWRTPKFERIPLVALTGLLAVAAAPWVHTYDMIPLSVAVVVLATTTRRPSLALLGIAWFWPGAVVLLPIPLPLSVASMASVAWLVWREVRHSTRTTWGSPSTLVHPQEPIGSQAGQIAG
ncbi:MAG: glycosyltransferase family 87 protein [Acetobacteraceae bacterium]